MNEDGEIVYDCKIHDRHIKEAISLWDDLVWDMPETMKMANANPAVAGCGDCAEGGEEGGRACSGVC